MESSIYLVLSLLFGRYVKKETGLPCRGEVWVPHVVPFEVISSKTFGAELEFSCTKLIEVYVQVVCSVEMIFPSEIPICAILFKSSSCLLNIFRGLINTIVVPHNKGGGGGGYRQTI